MKLFAWMYLLHYHIVAEQEAAYCADDIFKRIFTMRMSLF